MSSIFSTSSDVQTEERQHLFLFFINQGGTHMRSLKMAFVAVLITGTMAVQAQAQGYGVNGLLLGAGSGALVGQAIGRDHEATLIGTAVGGMFGYIVGNEMDKDRYGRVHVAPQPVVYAPPPPPPPRYYDAYRPSHNVRQHHRPRYRTAEVCRETVVVREGYGHTRKEVTTVCRERDRWRDRRY
jgi:hypothetical protein